MKKLLSLTFLAVMALSIAASEANAQTAYGVSIVRGNPDTRIIDGYSGTWLDYYAGLYYDPEVMGQLYRTDDIENTLSSGRHIGYADIIPAEVYLRTTNFVEGMTYCTYSQHFVWSYFPYPANNWWFDPFRYSLIYTGNPPWGGYPFSYYYVPPRRYRLGSTEACITIPTPPLPTPTPIPPTPTPTPEPTPTPTPCNPSVEGSCFLENVYIGTANPIRPIGVTNGTNKAGVTVYVCEGPNCDTPVPNRDVELRVLHAFPNSGGHIDSGHLGDRPLGKLDKSSGRTGSNGYFFTNYNPSHISGFVRIEARVGNRTATKDVFVGVIGMTQLFDGANYRIKPNPDTAHPSNNWGSLQAVTSFPRIADAYKARYYPSGPMPDNDRLMVNEISLVFGGKFDLADSRRGLSRPDWHNLPRIHKRHREGNHIDVRCCSDPGRIPANREAAFTELSYSNGATHVLREHTPPHFHITFNNEMPTVGSSIDPLSVNTPHSFVEKAWEGAMGRFANQAEWEVWHNRLVAAKASGPAQLLTNALWLEQELYGSQEYIDRDRSDHEFIEDVFLSHLFREPTEQEKYYWIGVLRSITINSDDLQPDVGHDERMAFIALFGEEPEFESVVSNIVDGEVIVPPLPTPNPTP